MPLEDHDTMVAVQRFELTAEQREAVYEAMRKYDAAFNRLGNRSPELIVSLSAAKYAADRAICMILGVLAEARKDARPVSPGCEPGTCVDCGTPMLIKNTAVGACACCGKPAQGNFSIHRDDFGKGPEVPLCDACGAYSEPSCAEIWARIRARRVVEGKAKPPQT